MHDESYIQITIELAKKGRGIVSPKPLVGALVVKNGKIIGAAFKNSSSEESTEITAIKNSKDSVENAVLYTNLEPCIFSEADFECIDSLISSKIKKIVIGSVNPHLKYGGAAISRFKNAGIEVVSGVLEKECIELNKFYFKYCRTNCPFVTLKMAMTIDGKIADQSGKSKWISSVESRTKVHELRSEYDAVLVGIKTVKVDNPNLTVRLVEGKNPYRIILDTKLRLNINSRIIQNNGDGKLIIVTSKKNKTKKNTIAKFLEKRANIIFASENKEGHINLLNVMKKLGRRDITSLLVEGGGKVFSGFIKEKIDDEILIFIGPKILNEGIPLTRGLGINSLNKSVKYSFKELEKVGDDALLRLVRR